MILSSENFYDFSYQLKFFLTRRGKFACQKAGGRNSTTVEKLIRTFLVLEMQKKSILMQTSRTIRCMFKL